MNKVMSEIRDNFLRVMERIEKAAQGAGRNPEEINLVAVSKTVESARIKEAIEAGVSILGENYVQEAQKKIDEIGRTVSWHFVGHLQSNKAKYAVRLFDMIHSLDSIPLAEELNRRAEKEGRTMNAMIEINLSGETTKFGAEEERAFDIARRVLNLSHLSLVGLMTMPPYFDDPRLSRPYYIRLRELKEKMIKEGIPLRELSMGMSNDFEIAIEEGATFVRVGTAIFGERKK
ncbi:MAG: YggS family pyridoxal phosphate-dependent enzyme [Thermodesulfobacteriota bacterium]|nr:YggS family pyridoxal phosphate-dependent enzyme [Thermodesulfobacteriota bacterium]